MIEIDQVSFDKLEDIFDGEFRNIFGDERIVGKSVTFVKPDEILVSVVHVQTK